MLDRAAAQGLFDNEVPALRVNFEARIMGALMPRESEVAARFNELWKTQGVRAATDYFYHLCIASNYIRTAQIAKNIQWSHPCQYGALEVTINLTKPEKDPKTIALERLQPAASYPKCMLCIENIGYAGRVNFPARQTHRVVPISLCGEQWYLQYSPYAVSYTHLDVYKRQYQYMASFTAMETTAAASASPPGTASAAAPARTFSTPAQPMPRPVSPKMTARMIAATHSSRSWP